MNKEESLECAYPEFDKIVQACKEKIKLKFFEYGNSWQDWMISDAWWKKRIQTEVKEIFKQHHPYDAITEIIDAINILAMYHAKKQFEYELSQSVGDPYRR